MALMRKNIIKAYRLFMNWYKWEKRDLLVTIIFVKYMKITDNELIEAHKKIDKFTNMP